MEVEFSELGYNSAAKGKTPKGLDAIGQPLKNMRRGRYGVTLCNIVQNPIKIEYCRLGPTEVKGFPRHQPSPSAWR
jgi:hypothetical protein